MKKEFLDFLNTKEILPPNEVYTNILNKVKNDFKEINAKKLIAKFILINFMAGVFTLTVCPQFGLGPIGGGHGISHYFMHIGLWACAVFCSAFYFLIAQTIALITLTNREIRWIAQKRFFVLPALVVLSFIVLNMIGYNYSNSDHEMFFKTEYQVIWILFGLVITQLTFNLVSFNFKKINKASLG